MVWKCWPIFNRQLGGRSANLNRIATSHTTGSHRHATPPLKVHHTNKSFHSTLTLAHGIDEEDHPHTPVPPVHDPHAGTFHEHLTMLEPLLRRLRKAVGRRGVRALFHLEAQLHQVAGSGGALTAAQMWQCLQRYAADLTHHDMDAMHRELTALSRSGTVSPEDVLHCVRGRLKPKNAEIVLKAFRHIHHRINGIRAVAHGAIAYDDSVPGPLPMGAVRACYEGSEHPDVLKGQHTAAEMSAEFLETFYPMRGDDETLSFDDFVRYYTGVAVSVHDDDIFQHLLWRVWGLHNKALEDPPWTKHVHAFHLNHSFSNKYGHASAGGSVALMAARAAESEMERHRHQRLDHGRLTGRWCRGRCIAVLARHFMRQSCHARVTAVALWKHASPHPCLALGLASSANVSTARSDQATSEQIVRPLLRGPLVAMACSSVVAGDMGEGEVDYAANPTLYANAMPRKKLENIGAVVGRLRSCLFQAGASGTVELRAARGGATAAVGTGGARLAAVEAWLLLRVHFSNAFSFAGFGHTRGWPWCIDPAQILLAGVCTGRLLRRRSGQRGARVLLEGEASLLGGRLR